MDSGAPTDFCTTTAPTGGSTSVGAESQAGLGSTFWVDLEAVEALETAVTAAIERVPDRSMESGRGRTVLYVEDNLSNLRLVERILARRPATKLIAAMQGGLALELAREHSPDLILLDMHLPDIEGDEVLRRLREDPATRHIPVDTVRGDTPQDRTLPRRRRQALPDQAPRRETLP